MFFRKIERIIVFYGLWIHPAAALALIKCAELVLTTRRHPLCLSFFGYAILWCIAFVPCLVITIRNIYLAKFRHKTDFTILGQLIPDQAASLERVAMQYPPIPSTYLSRDPDGFILGKHGKQYVRVPLDPNNILHACVLGSPGSGKSAGVYISTLLANFARKVPPMTIFALDIKPELAIKSAPIRSEYVRVVNPTDPTTCGWNVYYRLSKTSSPDDVLQELDGIARALIVSSNPSDGFFVTTARTIFKGFLLYYWELGFDFVDSVRKLVSCDVISTIREIVTDVEHCPPDSKVYSLLVKFIQSDSEAFQDVLLTMNEHLNIFLEDSVKYCLQDNPNRVSPADLYDGRSIFLSLPEKDLDRMSDLFRLFSFQVLQAVEEKKEDSKPWALILDEFARIGKLEKILDTLATARSRKVSVWMAYQDQNQLKSSYGANDATAILNMCEIKCILSCSDHDTASVISSWTGEYREEKVTYRRRGLFGKEPSVSSEWRKIVSPADIMSLRKSGEVMLFLEGSYIRTERIRYFEDPILSKYAAHIKKINTVDDDC